MKCSSINDLEKKVEVGEISSGNVREVVGLLEIIIKIFHPTYLINDEESLIVTTAKIEDSHGLFLESHAISEQIQCILKATNCWCSEYDILKTLSLKYLLNVFKRVK